MSKTCYSLNPMTTSKPTMTSVAADDQVPQNSTSLEAAKIMGKIWCDSPVKFIDVWCCEWLSEEFIKEFLNICKERGNTLKAFQIRWGAHNCPGGEFDWCTNDMIDQCIIEWVGEQISVWPQKDKDHDVMVRAYRKMFQSFIESMKIEDSLE